MKNLKSVHEREVWLIDFEPTRGIEIQKIRPAVVIRKFSKTHFVVLPITSKSKSEKISVRFSAGFLNTEKNWINISQIRTVDISRFRRKFGKISPAQYLKIKNKTAKVLQLPPHGAYVAIIHDNYKL